MKKPYSIPITISKDDNERADGVITVDACFYSQAAIGAIKNTKISIKLGAGVLNEI